MHATLAVLIGASLLVGAFIQWHGTFVTNSSIRCPKA
jgi:hypothetical protein